jgi:N-formylglutamate deformylase
MTYQLICGSAPLLVSVPHCGTELPPALADRLMPRAQAVEDTDWFLDRLYAFATGLGASLLVPRYSRYLIDLNRPSENTPMYPGQNNTELCPTRFFTGEPLYRDGRAPGADEVAERVKLYWRPYHEALAGELARLHAAHGHVVLFDAHSIKSEVPWLFEGRLPHMNLGTVGGASCAPGLRSALSGVLAAQTTYSHVVDGRFKGGHITRENGRPAEGRHAVQLEMCWRSYMEETPPRWNDGLAAQVSPLLRELVLTMRDWRPEPA